MADSISFEVEGIEQLEDGFNDFLQHLADELRPGFVPEHRYFGMGGVPFTLEKIELVGRQTGFMVRDG